MSATVEEDGNLMCCASCGITAAGGDELVPCDGKKRVAELQDQILSCTERVAELKDQILCKQPESTQLDDIKRICDDFNLAKDKREAEGSMDERCIFCEVSTYEELMEHLMRRVDDLVRYCTDECQQEHKSEHEEACKKREAELRDELLFKQPKSTHLGDCPICTLPLPLDMAKSIINTCCSKVICNGCRYANEKREYESRLEQRCLFCREPAAKTHEEGVNQIMKRIEANDSVALCGLGVEQYYKGDYRSAFDYYTKAAELGDAQAHYLLSILYEGQGVKKDRGKQIHHLEEAAIGGHPQARYELGVHEWNNNDNAQRAVKHWAIAATQGEDNAIKSLMKAFRDPGCVTHDGLAAFLRAHHDAVEATKSQQREAAEEYYRNP